MDYKKAYNRFVKHFKSTTAKQRLFSRNQNDKRLENEVLYTENHHIIPRSLGGGDDDFNLVELLPEEHLFMHKLRYKAYNNREDMLAVRYMLNGFSNSANNNKSLSVCEKLTRQIKKDYVWIKQNSYDFRIEHGWQTEEGRKRISESRKNTYPVKDEITGEMIGSIDKDHPNIKNGIWVHHSKGKVPVTRISDDKKLYIDSDEYQKNKHLYIYRGPNADGKNNPRWKNIETDEIFDDYRTFCIKHKMIVSLNHFYIFFPDYPKKRLHKMKTYDRIRKEFPTMPYLVKQGYKKEELNLYFDGKTQKNIFYS